MSLNIRTPVEFGRFRMDVAQRRLTLGGSPVSISPEAFDLLAALLEKPGELLTKQELLARVWPDTIVEEGTLGRHISDLRRALGDDQRYIETVSKYGYRFVMPRKQGTEEPAAYACANEPGRAPDWIETDMRDREAGILDLEHDPDFRTLRGLPR
jgi:DNA-binding winged helix-turn-helix (wHTH) protein